MNKRYEKRIAKEFLLLVGSFLVGLIIYLVIMYYDFKVNQKIKNISATISEQIIIADSLSGNYISKLSYQSIIGETENDSIKKHRNCKLDFVLNTYDSIRFKNRGIENRELYVYRLYDYVIELDEYHGKFIDFKLKYSDTDRVNYAYKYLYSDGHYCKTKFEFYQMYFPSVAQKYLNTYSINHQDSVNFNSSTEIKNRISELKKTELQYHSRLFKTKPTFLFAIKIILSIMILLMVCRYFILALIWSIRLVK